MGVRVSILPMGQAIGAELPRRASFPYIIAVTFLIGFAVTVAEPDVIALSKQVDTVTGDGVNHFLLVTVIAIGVGLATGPMAVTFLLAITVGIASATEGRDPVTDGFGLAALIALAPILSIMSIGIAGRIK